MKRTLSGILVVILIVCMTVTASADSDSVGKVLMDNAESYLKLYVSLSKLSRTGGDEYLDKIYAYALLYLNGEIIYYTEMDKLLGVDAVNPLIYGFSDMVHYLSGAKVEYIKEKITKEEYKKRLFLVVDNVLPTK